MQQAAVGLTVLGLQDCFPKANQSRQNSCDVQRPTAADVDRIGHVSTYPGQTLLGQAVSDTVASRQGADASAAVVVDTKLGRRPINDGDAATVQPGQARIGWQVGQIATDDED